MANENKISHSYLSVHIGSLMTVFMGLIPVPISHSTQHFFAYLVANCIFFGEPVNRYKVTYSICQPLTRPGFLAMNSFHDFAPEEGMGREDS